MRIALVGYWPEIWRSFRVPSSASLSTLHTVIQDVMGWSNRHLHEFSTDFRCFDGDDERDDEDIDTGALSLTHFFRGPGDELEYVYDFGDAWRHRLVATAFESGTMDRPECLAGAGRCPPEDIGGVLGYRAFLDALADPNHSEHTFWVEKCGRDFDPTGFSAADVNERLAECALNARVEVERGDGVGSDVTSPQSC